MRLFLGEYENIVDKQRRVSLPKIWRSTEHTQNKFVLFPGRNKSIQMLTMGDFGKMVQKLKSSSFANADASRALAVIGANSQMISCDKQGRFQINEKLMIHANIENRVVLVGAMTDIQIYSPNVWQELHMNSGDCLDVIQGIQEQSGGLDDMFAKIRFE